ncbi:MAG: hypothetical protein PHP26_04720, partial [Syntrophomonas sp.]|nr:hypothetical protein [Syntrophomonas sp.]
QEDLTLTLLQKLLVLHKGCINIQASVGEAWVQPLREQLMLHPSGVATEVAERYIYYFLQWNQPSIPRQRRDEKWIKAWKKNL